MNILGNQSPAVDRAELSSDRTRILAILATLAALLVVVLVRTYIDRGWGVLPGYLTLLAAMAVYEGFAYRLVNNAIQSETTIPSRVWSAIFLGETLFPTVVLFFETNEPLIGPYRPLSSATVLIYFIFVILSTLRLRPRLSQLTGVFCAGGFSVVVLYTHVRYPEPPPLTVAYPIPVYATFAVVILLSGFVAGAVAAEIRKHVLVALSEARHVERLRHDLNIARTIQQGLLPKRVSPRGAFDAAGWNQPADETGGDYFDWQELSDGRFAVSLADVSGHGIGPALLAAVCRAYARATLPWQRDISEVMSRMNQLLAEDLPGGKFITFVLAILDPDRSTIQLLSAGHGPLLVLRAGTNTVERIDAHGIPCGILAAADYSQPAELELQQGDALILTTDGFFEWENPDGQQFGVERLEAAILEARDHSAAEMIRLIHEQVLEFAGGAPQDDDLTAFVVKRLETPHAA